MDGSCAARVVVGLSNMLVRWPADLGNPLAMFSLPSETEVVVIVVDHGPLSEAKLRWRRKTHPRWSTKRGNLGQHRLQFWLNHLGEIPSPLPLK